MNNIGIIEDKEVVVTGTYTMRASELSADFISSIRQMFHDREIEISVRDVADETSYLLSTEENRAHLMRSIQQAERKDNLVPFPEESL